LENEHKNLLRLLTSLRVDRSKGIALHKPLLLLAVLELAGADELKELQLKLMPELAFRFSV
jgi:putative restriction endonuclease